MAEPTTIKSALAAVAVGYFGVAGGEFAVILAGGFIGGLLSLEGNEPMRGWWPPLRHVLSGIAVAALLTSALSVVAVNLLPQAWQLSSDYLWLGVSGMVAWQWRRGMRLVWSFIDRRVAGKAD